MNGLYLVIISALVFVLAYRFYGAFIAAKVLTLNQYKVTPAFRFEDGHDYVPTNKYVVFGHHFAAIAGASQYGDTDEAPLRRSTLNFIRRRRHFTVTRNAYVGTL